MPRIFLPIQSLLNTMQRIVISVPLLVSTISSVLLSRVFVRRALIPGVLILGVLISGCAPAETEDPVSEGPAAPAWIVFSSARSNNSDIYAIDPVSGETVLVAGSPAPEGTVRYDAFRDRIVYHRYDMDPARAVLVADGEDLFVDPNGDVAPAWSPDGGWITYVAQRDGQEDLFIAEPDGSGERRLTNDTLVERYPAWSPDGRSIVFALRLESGWDLHTIDPFEDDTPVQRITEGGVYVGHPAWSPDGRYIAYDTLIDEQAEIVIRELATGEVTRLTNRAGNDLIPAWSLDNRHVAFGGEPDNAGNWDLWMVDVETLEMKRLTSQPSYDGGPVFVPASALGR